MSDGAIVIAQSVYESWSLQELADEANLAAATAERQQKASVQNAVQSGRMLLAAKKNVLHGEWAAWLGENWTLSGDRARVFMRLAQRPIEELDLFETVAEADAAARKPKQLSTIVLDPITDDQIETETPLAQPSNKKITPETTKKVDAEHREDTANRAQSKAAYVHVPDQAPQQTETTTAELVTTEDAEARVLFALREIGQVIQGVKDRKKLAAKIRKLADEIDPPRKTTGPVSLEDWTEYGQEFAGSKAMKATEETLAESYDHYTSNGWKQNNGRPIKDWQATCRNAIRRHAKWSEGKVESRETGMDWSAYDD